MNRILLMIDGSNFFYLQKNILGWMIDPLYLKNAVANWGLLVEARYYLSIRSGEESEGEERYRRALWHMRYNVIPINLKTIRTPDGVKEKADADVHLAIDALLMKDHYDTLVLVSGDSDFAYLLHTLRVFGKRVKVISTGGVIAGELLEEVGEGFVDIIEMRNLIEKGTNHDETGSDREG